MSRLKILFFWLFAVKNNVTFYELFTFLTKPAKTGVAKKNIELDKPKIAITTSHNQNGFQEIINIITGYVTECKYYAKRIDKKTSKPVLIHFWI